MQARRISKEAPEYTEKSSAAAKKQRKYEDYGATWIQALKPYEHMTESCSPRQHNPQMTPFSIPCSANTNAPMRYEPSRYILG
jgi:hypothetical protein